MLALVVAATLAQGMPVAADPLTPRQIREEIDLLTSERPTLYVPISTLVASAIIGAAAVAFMTFDTRVAGYLAVSSLSVAGGGLLSLLVTLWGRSRVGEMIEQRERLLLEFAPAH